MSHNFQTEFQTTSFSEYKTTTSKGIKSQIYSSSEESSKPLENFEISNLNSQNLDFAKILPLKTLSTFNKDKSFKYKDNINSDYLNNFNNTSEQSNNFDYGDLKIESTSEVTQNIQNNLTEEKQNLNNFDINNLQNGENIISTDINNINDNFDLQIYKKKILLKILILIIYKKMLIVIKLLKITLIMKQQLKRQKILI